jgi:hypothetical protein
MTTANHLTPEEIARVVDYCLKYFKNDGRVVRIGYAIDQELKQIPTPHSISQIELALTKSKKYESRLHRNQEKYEGDFEIFISNKTFLEKHPIIEKIFLIIIGYAVALIVSKSNAPTDKAEEQRECRQDSAIHAIADSLHTIQRLVKVLPVVSSIKPTASDSNIK